MFCSSGVGHSAGARVTDGSLISFLHVSVGVQVADAQPHHSVAPRVLHRLRVQAGMTAGRA